MEYILKHFEDNILWFEMDNVRGELQVEIKQINSELIHLKPLDLELNNDSLSSWLRRRTIPRNRAYVSNFLAKLGLNERDTKGIIDICQGLSLKDAYWVVKMECNDTFASKNLYDHSFNTALASIAFTGYGSYTRISFRSSPEFTTNGMLAKSWRRIKDSIYLYKSGTEGFANSGLEPYSEMYASQIANAMELHHVNYELSRWKKDYVPHVSYLQVKRLDLYLLEEWLKVVE